MENILRKAYRFRGRVQGVGFRYRACYAARETGVTGWVRNEFDSSVMMEVQGTEAQIDRVLQLIDSSPYIVISNVSSTDIPLAADESDFSVVDDMWY